jgi:hypothetical protein
VSATEDRPGQGFAVDIRAYRSIQLWMDVVNGMYHLSEAEWEGRLQLVRQFCESEGKDPDEMIAEARGDRAEKIDYMRRLNLTLYISNTLTEGYRPPLKSRAGH